MRSAPAVTAVIAAAGSGERLGAGGPKAFVPLAGKPMVEWSIDALRTCEAVSSIVIVVPPGQEGRLGGEAVAGGDADGFELTVVTGGATRAESVTNALAAVETELVAIHDAARPLLTAALVEALVADLAAAPDAAGVIAATPVTDTVKRAAEGTRTALTTPEGANAVLVVEGTEDRSRLWAAQTPQVFRLPELRRALGQTPIPEPATDEAMLVEAAGGTVLIHPCGPENLKVTTPLDLRIAELLLNP
jgi:2-C-methyl-D-erythritol 4-phosphate cytidylyltransferase